MRRLILLLCFVVLLVPLSSLAQQLPPVNPSQTTGDILIAGSPLLEPMTTNLTTFFSLEGYQGIISVDANGTDTALLQLCTGEVDLVMADRQMTAEETNACTAAGRPPVPFHVATRAIIVAVARQNNFATSVTSLELQQIFGTAINWSDVRVGWPEQTIQRYGPAKTSPEFELFANVLFGGDTTKLATALGAQYNEDVNISVSNVVASTQAIGFFDAAFALANSNLLQGVSIDGIAPDQNTIGGAQYPLAQRLIIYTTSTTLQEKPQVADFTNYYITNAPQAARDVILFPPSANALTLASNAWFAAVGQTAPVPTATPPPVIPPTEVPDAETTSEPSVEPAVEATPDMLFSAEEQALLISARVDLEALATEEMGVGRPQGWSGELDVNNPQLPLLLRLDLELLAASIYGAESRPDDWFGAVNSTKLAIARDIRHDLELLADTVFEMRERPGTWAGGEPYYRCDRSTQALVSLLQKYGYYTIEINSSNPNFCELLAKDIALFTEINLLPLNVVGGSSNTPSEVTVNNQYGVAFGDTSGLSIQGLIPEGTVLTPIARSYAQFSNMTLVEGDGFRVFVERTNTSIANDLWEALPNVAEMEVVEIVCEADWC